MSRDRKGANTLPMFPGGQRSKHFRHKESHGFALLLDDVPHGLEYITVLEKPSCASMARPALAMRSVTIQPVQRPAGIRLKFVHDFLGPNLGFEDYVQMVGPHMCGQ